MATLSSLVSRVRLELADQGETFQSTIIGDGVVTRVNLPHQPVNASTMTVVSGSVTLTQGTHYVVDERGGYVTLSSPVPDGQLLVVNGTAFRYFTDATIELFINTAFGQHSHGTGKTLATLPAVEEYPVALLAAVEGLYVLLTDAAYDIDIMTPEGVSIPRSQRYQHLLDMIQMRQKQYQELCAALNVGLHRIEMFDLRRVSRTTGRYVSIYVAQELEDTNPPQRVHPHIDRHGAAQPQLDDVLFEQDIVIIEQQSFTYDLILGVDVTNLSLSPVLRTLPGSGSVRARMKIEVNDPLTGDVTISLGRAMTILPPTLFWELMAVKPNGDLDTLVRGKVTVKLQGSK